MTEKQWIREIQRGRGEYLNCIAEKYYDDIYRFCCYQTGNTEEAYDITQETFLRFIRNVEHYQSRNLKGYLLTIAANLCRDYFRGRKTESIADTETLSGSNVIAEKEAQLTLMDCLGSLADFQREALLLHYYYGFKIREIAAMTGSNPSTVKSRIRQGTEKLKRYMDKEGLNG
ncbi:MAG: RNA polymerase sigma factor [Eubacteriales bacterium]|nr:RNA polymerase sigma factor [Eubacteriales bacterium]